MSNSPVYEAIQKKIERDERRSEIAYDLARVQVWERRAPLTFGRRAPGLLSRLLCWFAR